MSTKTFTLGEFIDAIEKDGLKQTFGSLWRTGNNKELIITYSGLVVWDSRNPANKIGKACALGQGFINLGIKNISTYERSYLWTSFHEYIVSLNDERELPLATIAKRAREEFEENLNTVIEGEVFDYSPYLNG